MWGEGQGQGNGQHIQNRKFKISFPSFCVFLTGITDRNKLGRVA